MVVPATGHQVRCITCVLVVIFNKKIGFLCELKCFALSIFCEEYLQPSPGFVLLKLSKKIANK